MIRRIFDEAWEYVKDSRKYIYWATGLFFVFGVIGFIFVDQLGFLEEVIRQIIDQTEGLNSLELVIFIFRNNFMSALSAVLFGIVLGIFPLFNAISNGLVLGYVAARVVPIAGFLSLWRILPHGIFELPAIFIAIGIGMKLGTFVFVPRKKMRKELLYRLDRSLKVVVAIILPLLVIAAIIEGLLIGLLS